MALAGDVVRVAPRAAQASARPGSAARPARSRAAQAGQASRSATSRRTASQGAQGAALDRDDAPGEVRGGGRQHEGGDPGELVRACRSGAAGCAASDAARAAAGSSAPASSWRTRSVSTRPGISPTTRPPVGPELVGQLLDQHARGRGGGRWRWRARPAGERTEVESTQASARSGAVACATTARLTPAAPRGTRWSNAVVHCSSVVAEHGAGRRAADADQGAVEPPERAQGHEAGQRRRWPGRSGRRSRATARSGPSSATASASTSARRATRTTRAPSATSWAALARPSPPLAAVTTKTRSVSPRSTGSDSARGELGLPGRGSGVLGAFGVLRLPVRRSRRSPRMKTTTPASADARRT